LNCRIGGVFLAAVVLSGGVLAGQEKTPTSTKDGLYEMKAEDAPLEWVLESFLSIATGVYGEDDHDAESYRDFCNQYGIDSSWRSADRLGTAYRQIYKDYADHLAQARRSSNYKDLTGQDPNDWRTEAIGEAFGEIYEELRADGLSLTFDRFVALIEKLHRSGFTRYSSEPFNEQELARSEELFWSGAGKVSNEAAQYHQEEVDR
jgi:hypothetical protein